MKQGHAVWAIPLRGKPLEKCKLDVETFLVKALRGQLRDYWIDDCSIEEYAVSRYLWPLT